MFRHYWVLVKLLITIPATILLLVQMRHISLLANVAAKTTLSSADLRGLRIQMVAAAGSALLVLLVATTLSVYKPPGTTRYGQPYPASNSDAGVGQGPGSRTGKPRWVNIVGIVVIVPVLVFAILHLTGHGLGRHTP